MVRVGIDLGGTNIAAGVIDDNYSIVGKATKKSHSYRPSEDIFKDIVDTAKEAVKNSGESWDAVEFVGMGIPGTYNKSTGIIEFCSNINILNFGAKKYLEDALNKKTFIDNDANCAALGEFFAGAGKGSENLVAITLGTGVGGGIIIDKKIYSGFNYAGGEIGHTVIVTDGEECNCGRLGCWEKYASATALIKQTKDALRKNPDSKMWDLVNKNIDKTDGRTAFDAMRLEDHAAAEVVKRYIYYVACGIINVINIFQPEIICIGGGISKEGDTLINPIKKYVEHERYSAYAKNQTNIVQAMLGNDAGIIGAALLGAQND